MNKTIAFIKAALRRVWSRSTQRQDALKAARISRGKYECANCNLLFGRKEIQIDHILPVGKFTDWNTYIDRLFVDSNGLQVLCRICHLNKTKAEGKKRRNNENKQNTNIKK